MKSDAAVGRRQARDCGVDAIRASAKVLVQVFISGSCARDHGGIVIDRSVRLLLVVLVLLSGGAWLGGAAARAHGPRGITVPDRRGIATPNGEQAERSAAEPVQQAEEAKADEATESADQPAEEENAAAEDSAASEDADTSADAGNAPTESVDTAAESADAGGNAEPEQPATPADPAPSDERASAGDRESAAPPAATETEQERYAREAKEGREKQDREWTEAMEKRKRENPCSPEFRGGTPQRSMVKFMHSGAYIADFYVEWDAPCGESGKAAFNGKTAGFQTMADFPAAATNIRVRATNQTGLVWQPNRTIFERTLPKVDGVVCFEVVGTTLGSSVNDCKP